MTSRMRTLAVVVTAVVALPLAGAFVYSRVQTTDEVESRTKAPPPSVVTAPVTKQRLVEAQTLPCTVRPSYQKPIPIATTVGDPVVTATTMPTKSAVDEGEVVLEVSGRPIIVIRGEIPPYRELSLGDSGPDVDQLKQALSRLGLLSSTDLGAPDITRQTAQAVKALYERSGYERDGVSRSVVPAEELLPVAELPSVLNLRGTRVGDTPEQAQPVIVSPQKVADCDVTDGELKELQASESTRLLVGRRSHPTQIDRVVRSDETGPDDGESGQSQVVLTVANSSVLREGSAATLRYVTSRSPQRGLVVPVTALWRTGDGTDAVSVLRDGEKAAVEVRITYEGATSVQVRPMTAGALVRGDEVVVSGGR